MKKRMLAAILIGIAMLSVTGCSNPKRDAVPTDIQEQMQNGTL